MAISDSIYLGQEKAKVFDWSTILITILLVSIGLLSIYSATAESNMSKFFERQLQAVFIGICAMITIMFLPQRVLKINAYLIYGISLSLLLLVLIKGKVINGTQGWIKLGSFSLQPSEFAKFGTLLALAKYMAQKGTDIRTIRDLFICFAITIVPTLLILKQPDFGSGTVLLVILMGVLFWTGFNSFLLYIVITLPFLILSSLKGTTYFIVLCTLISSLSLLFKRNVTSTAIAIALFIGIGFAGPFVYNHLQQHQQARIDTFLNPGSDPRGSGYNVWQSMMAVGSGGITGKGFMAGTLTQLRYIPEQWTDFIFSVPAEEWGFMGGFLVIFLQASLILKFSDAAYSVEDKFFSILCAGIAFMILYHCVINIGMVIGVMPVMGIPLPFMSYGGTAIITDLSMVGIVLNIYRNAKLKRN